MTGFYVRCPDGAVRHSGTFATEPEAIYWSHWGHCCLVNGHQIVKAA